ncbi:MAG: 2-oxoacid:acceptor oxidoreductase subunit alpha [Chromatiales bacterium]|nr:2-oxoacid:acceptor oxidoreductase subunit alpha [Chromatiales bacterium]
MNSMHTSQTKTYSVAIIGSGGSGVVTTGQIMLKAIANAGFYGLMSRSSGPQIRGGESAAMLRIGKDPVTCLDDRFDILMAFDWLNSDRFNDEIPLGPNSTIIRDPDAGDIPQELLDSGAAVIDAPLTALSKEIKQGRVNMAGLGFISDLMGIPKEAIQGAVEDTLRRKGPEVTQAAQSCIEAGYHATKTDSTIEKLPAIDNPNPRWNISGNEASGLGAVRGGVRFVAAYPITPASEILEWLAPNLEKVGGSLLQAEDELASVNMIIGGSFGGVPSLTATSGPGLSLMMEGLGLAVTSETPIVVSNVMRGGPSTGIPTKSEQSDLNIALYGFHGDAPHLVLGALDIQDCCFTTQWAVQLTEELQTVAIVLSDQSQGQARAVIDPPPEATAAGVRITAPADSEDYLRYSVTDSGVSPMAIPGTPGGIYTADGLEHNPKGTPSSMAGDHQVQLDKRLRKIVDYNYQDDWAVTRGEGENVIVTWGSSSGASFEAAERLTANGHPTKAVALRLLAPLQIDRLLAQLNGAKRIVVVEQNHSAQFFQYLHANQVLPGEARSLARPGPLPIRPSDIVTFMMEDF